MRVADADQAHHLRRADRRPLSSTATVKWNGKTSSQLAVEVKVPLKKPTEFKVIGQSFPRRDLPGKVFGTLEYVNDVRLPRHAARPHDPSDGRRRRAGQGRRRLDQGHSRREGGLDQGPARGRRREGMERGQGRATRSRSPGRSRSRISPATTSCTTTSARRRSCKRKIQRENGNFEEGLKQAVRIIEGRVRVPDPVARQHRPGLRGRRRARRRGDDLDLDAEALRLGRLRRRTAWHCRARRCARSGCSAPAPTAATTRATPPPTPPCSRSISAGRCACSTCATRQLAWDPKGTASVNRSRAGLDASGKVIAYENISKAFSRTDTNTRESRAADVLAGHLLGLPLKPQTGFRNPGRLLHVRPRPARLGDRPAADGPRLAAAHHPSARSLWAADPVRQRVVHGRGGGCDQHRSGRFPAALSDQSARPRRGAHRGRAATAGRSGRRRATTRRQATSRSAAASPSAATSRTFIGLVAEVRVHHEDRQDRARSATSARMMSA